MKEKQKVIYFFLICIYLYSVTTSVQAVTRYVNPSGPAGSGTQTSPWGGFSDITWSSVDRGDILTGSGQIFTNQNLDIGSINMDNGSTDDTIITDMTISDSPTNGIYADHKNHIKYQNLMITNSNGRGIYHRGSDHIIIDGCTIRDNESHQVNFSQYGDEPREYWTITNSTISSQKFTSGVKREGVLMNFNDAVISHVNISNNSITGGFNGIKFLPNSDKLIFNGEDVYSHSIVIADNNFTDIGHNAVTVHKIRGALGDPSYISRNTILDSGSFNAGVVSLNVLQIHNAYDFEIVDNYIDGVETNSPDGCGIILDWNPDGVIPDIGVPENRCRRVIVKNNYVANAHKGISTFMCDNSKIYGNVIVNTVFGMKNTGSASTGNQYYNNTFVNNGFYNADYNAVGAQSTGEACLLINHASSGGQGAEVEFRNNIFRTNRKVYHISNSFPPNEANNLFYQNMLASDITYTNSINADPLLTSNSSTNDFDHDLNYRIENISPAMQVGESVGLTGEIDRWENIIQAVPNIGADAHQIQSSIRADVDQNSLINTIDALLILRDSLELSMIETNWQASVITGDVNCVDGSNSIDAMLILRYSLGLNIDGTGWCE